MRRGGTPDLRGYLALPALPRPPLPLRLTPGPGALDPVWVWCKRETVPPDGRVKALGVSGGALSSLRLGSKRVE
jgi:hypothetical protein